MVEEIVDDEPLDGKVLSQDPEGGTDAEQGTTVVIVVGRFEAPPTETTDDRHRPSPVSRQLRVAVVAGGRSSEHEISLASARSVLEALDPARYEVTHDRDRPRRAAGRSRAPSNRLLQGSRAPRRCRCSPTRSRPRRSARSTSCCPILHGPFGEDGTVQGLLELAGVPYVGAGVAASALCMDKDLFKAVLRDRGIPVARNVTLRLGDEIENPFGYPVFVKPARLGSSVGISKAHDEAELEAAVALARRHDEKVLVEEFVAGHRGRVRRARQPAAAADRSVVGEIVPHAEWYDYAAKYDEGGSDIIVPARIPDETPRACRRSRSTPSSRPSARAWRASTSSCARTARWS